VLSASQALLDAQRAPSVVPALRVRLIDRDLGVPRLRWAPLAEGTDPAGPCAAAVTGDGALIRARIVASNGGLWVQRVPEPLDSQADFDAWSGLGTVATGPRLGCAAAGDRALIATVQTDNETVEVRESTDGGVSFGSASTVAVASGTVTAVACAVRADGSAAVAWAVAGEVIAVRRAGTGSWTSPAAWSHALDSIDALAMYDAPDYALLVSGEDGEGRRGAWTSMLGDGDAAPAGEWTPLAPVVRADAGTDISYLATGAGHAAAPRLMIIERYEGPGEFDRAQIVRPVAGTFFEDGAWAEPQPLDLDSPQGLAFAASGTDAFLCAAHLVWHAPVPVALYDLSDDVLSAQLEESTTGTRLRLVLRHDLPLPDTLVAGAELLFDTGAVTPDGPHYASGRAYWIVSVTRTRHDGRATVEIEADGAIDALRRWRATRQVSWHDATAFQVLRAIARLAGVPLLSDGASVAATSISRDATIRPGESAWTAMQRVLTRLPDRPVARGHTLLLSAAPPDEQPVAYLGDGPDMHPLHSLHLTDARPALARARVIGAAAVAEAVDPHAASAGAPSTVLVDHTLWLHGDTQTTADALLRSAARTRDLGTLTAPPHAALEPGDVIEITDAATGADAERYRIASLRFDYVRTGPRPAAEMRLGLEAV
jgi:hypothetical protein